MVAVYKYYIFLQKPLTISVSLVLSFLIIQVSYHKPRTINAKAETQNSVASTNMIPPTELMHRHRPRMPSLLSENVYIQDTRDNLSYDDGSVLSDDNCVL